MKNKTTESYRNLVVSQKINSSPFGNHWLLAIEFFRQLAPLAATTPSLP